MRNWFWNTYSISHEERVVDLPLNVLLQLNVLHLLVLQNYVLPDALHGVEFVRGGVLDEEDLAEGALADHLADLEVLERGRLRLVSGEERRGATRHRLPHLHAVLVGGLGGGPVRRGGVGGELLAPDGLLGGEVGLARRGVIEHAAVGDVH